MAKPAPRKDGGYVLITVLVLALAASLVTFVSIKESRLQERMSGNQQKMVNAHQAAEKGVYDTLALINTHVTAGDNIADIQSSLNRTTGDYIISQASYSQPRQTFLSKGTYQDASAYIKANLAVQSGIYPFDAGVISCEWMEIQGSGHIDSYDPQNGKYDKDTNKNENAKVEALDPGDRLVKLNGASPIRGDVMVNGNVEVQGSAEITGTINTTQNLNMSGGGTKIGGANVGGNLTMTSSSTITGHASVTGDVTANPNTTVGSLSYGGTLTNNNTQNQLTATAGAIVNQATPAPVIPSKPCDPLDITTAFAGYDSLPSQGRIKGYHYQHTSYNFTPSSGEVYADDNAQNSTTISNVSPTEVSVFGETENVYVLDSLWLEGSTLNITGGDVTFIIKGDLNTNGGGAAINIAPGSSVKFLVQGKVQFQSDGLLNPSDAGAGTNDGKAPLSIYSSYSGSEGVRADGAFNGGYAAIYAPLTDAKIEGSGTLSGAIRAKTLTVRGAGGMHYDESLGQVKQGEAAGTVTLTTMQDYYP